LVDALVSGISGGNPLEVRVFFRAPFKPLSLKPRQDKSFIGTEKQ